MNINTSVLVVRITKYIVLLTFGIIKGQQQKSPSSFNICTKSTNFLGNP